MEIPIDIFEAVLEQLKQVQFALRDVRAEMRKWKKGPGEASEPVESIIPAKPETVEQETVETIEPPTEKQRQFLISLGVEEIPASKEEARQLLLQLNAKRQAGQYVVPPTERQMQFLKGLGYSGPMPDSKDAAWKLLQELKGNV